jgi:flagellar protein FlaJ
MNPFFIGLGLFIIPSLFSSITFLLIYSYPVSVRQTRKRDIDANLPFALTHMAAVAESGAPPFTIFKILAEFEEYGEISKEAARIKRDVEVFGLDALSALRERVQKTPSKKFQYILQGLLSTIQSGGDIKTYLMEESKKSMFDYAIKKEKYNQLMSIYADLYTALLLAAPMIFIVVLSMLAVLGGNFFNLSIQEIMNIGIITLVFLNMVFITFLHITQPSV